MSEQLQRQADELDALITAMKRGETTPAISLTEAETKLTAELLNLAASTELDPDFRLALGAQLYRAASQAARQRPKPLTFWQKLEQSWSDLTMKRLVFTFGSLAAVAVIVLAVLFFQPGQDDGPEPVAGVDPTDTVAVVEVTDTAAPGEPTHTAEPVALALLPELEGMDLAAGGFGGGGGGEGVPAPEIDMSTFRPVNPFSETQFALNTTLPTELGPNTVLQQRPWVMDVATARQVANQWGFTGPLYTIPLPEQPEGAPAIELPPTYFVFDGTRSLQLDAQFIYYQDTACLTRTT
jgi:hypothetical protein